MVECSHEWQRILVDEPKLRAYFAYVCDLCGATLVQDFDLDYDSPWSTSCQCCGNQDCKWPIWPARIRKGGPTTMCTRFELPEFDIDAECKACVIGVLFGPMACPYLRIKVDLMTFEHTGWDKYCHKNAIIDHLIFDHLIPMPFAKTYWDRFKNCYGEDGPSA